MMPQPPEGCAFRDPPLSGTDDSRMQALTLFAMCAFGTILVPAQPELTAMFYASELGWNPLLVGVVAAAGQCVTYAALYLGGAQLVARWAFLSRQVERVRTRFAARLERGYLVTSALSGSVGLPPATAVAALANGFRVPLVHLLAVLFVFRAARLAFVAAFGRQVAAWWQAGGF